MSEMDFMKLSDEDLDLVIGGTTYYTIQSGDTLTKIANKFKTTVERLAECNNISKATIFRLVRPLKSVNQPSKQITQDYN